MFEENLHGVVVGSGQLLDQVSDGLDSLFVLRHFCTTQAKGNTTGVISKSTFLLKDTEIFGIFLKFDVPPSFFVFGKTNSY